MSFCKCGCLKWLFRSLVFGMYDVIILSVSRRRSISDLNCLPMSCHNGANTIVSAPIIYINIVPFAYRRYSALSMACWRVGELCGPVAHASPAHPGAVACVFGARCSKRPKSFVNPVLTKEACEISLCPVCKMLKVFSR